MKRVSKQQVTTSLKQSLDHIVYFVAMVNWKDKGEIAKSYRSVTSVAKKRKRANLVFRRKIFPTPDETSKDSFSEVDQKY